MYPPTVCSTPYKEKAHNCQGKLPPRALTLPGQAGHHWFTELEQQLNRNDQHSPFSQDLCGSSSYWGLPT